MKVKRSSVKTHGAIVNLSDNLESISEKSTCCTQRQCRRKPKWVPPQNGRYFPSLIFRRSFSRHRVT